MKPVANDQEAAAKSARLAVYALLIAKAKERRARLAAAYDVVLSWPEPGEAALEAAQNDPETAVNGAGGVQDG